MIKIELYKKALEHWEWYQILMVAEEASELSKSACKLLRHRSPKTILEMIEEFVDVEIMKEQMEIYFEKNEYDIDFRAKFKEFKQDKLKRLEARIKLFELKKTLDRS